MGLFQLNQVVGRTQGVVFGLRSMQRGSVADMDLYALLSLTVPDHMDAKEQAV